MFLECVIAGAVIRFAGATDTLTPSASTDTLHSVAEFTPKRLKDEVEMTTPSTPQNSAPSATKIPAMFLEDGSESDLEEIKGKSDIEADAVCMSPEEFDKSPLDTWTCDHATETLALNGLTPSVAQLTPKKLKHHTAEVAMTTPSPKTHQDSASTATKPVPLLDRIPAMFLEDEPENL